MSRVIEQRFATLLGNFGLLPFYALALAAWLPLDPVPARLIELAFIAYAAVILSFLGAVHWGLALATPQLDRTQTRHALGWGVLPSLLGWLALLLAMAGVKTWVVCLLLLVDFALCRAMDGALLRLYAEAPDWYRSLRTRLTVLVLIAVLILLFSTVRGG
jgi:hypothetical protein